MTEVHAERVSGIGHVMGLPLSKAAIYVRMSTDHQKYSIENQTAAMSEYAAKNRMDIVKTYTDGGRSGLNYSGRSGLQSLIADVKAGTLEFSSILVLDVTRWGRFPDADESAHYEFICRQAGVKVEYVAEPFKNDGSMQANLMKSIKRTMAAEYSRELSAKVFAGQCRLIEKGYKQGGAAGYGLRRMLINEKGEGKGILKRGEYKSLLTDRVILVPGPTEEVDTVNWIYRRFVDDGMTEGGIAAKLNQRGILTDMDKPWTRATVHQVLTNEKYIGNNVFNRSSFKLKIHRVENTPDMWVRADNAFQGIVDPKDFYAVQGVIRERSRKWSDDDMLSRLKALQVRQGWLSGFIIDEAEDMPSSCAYQCRFGSLIQAYRLIGYTPARDFRYIEINRHLRKLYTELVDECIAKIQGIGGRVQQDAASDLLCINEELNLSIVIARARQTDPEKLRWKVYLDTGLDPDLTLIIRMDAINEKPLDYYLLPALDVQNPKLHFSEENGLALDAYRFERLEPLFRLTEREQVTEVVWAAGKK